MSETEPGTIRPAPVSMPDKISDVADWGDRPLREPLFAERTPEQLEAADLRADEFDRLRGK